MYILETLSYNVSIETVIIIKILLKYLMTIMQQTAHS